MVNIMKIQRALKRFLGSIKQLILVTPQYIIFKSSGKRNVRFDVHLKDLKLCLSDATATTGFDRHYIFHTAWASRILASLRPKLHVDISSSLFFSGIVSAFVPVKFLDYRPANLCLSEIEEQPVDILELPFSDNSIESLSCMHVIEHIGLGRYGDPLNYDGDIQAVAELKRVVAMGGSLLFVVPISAKPYIAFNAHRVYGHDQVISMFDEFSLINFSLIPDDPLDGGLVSMPNTELMGRQRYGCGCYHFKKNRNC